MHDLMWTVFFMHLMYLVFDIILFTFNAATQDILE